MGFGDVKLTMGFGFLLGIYNGLTAVMLGFLLGALVGVILLYLPKVIQSSALRTLFGRFTMKSEIPFAPFLIGGFYLVFLLDVDFLVFIEMLIW